MDEKFNQPPPYSTPAQTGYQPPPTGQAHYATHSQTTVIHPGAGGVTVVQPGSAFLPNGAGNMVIIARLGSQPTRMTCNSCGADVITRVDIRSSGKTHLIAALLCLLTLWPCVWIPYCVDSCKRAEHYCPSCGAFLGSN